MKNENLKKAYDSASFLVDELRESLTEVDAVSAMILTDELDKAILIRNRLKYLIDMMEFQQ